MAAARGARRTARLRLAYALGAGELIGRGGLSRLDPVAEVTGQIRAALPGGGWARDREVVAFTERHNRRSTLREPSAAGASRAAPGPAARG